jgi:hypothetical protein
MLATDASNDGIMLGHDVVERDCRVLLEDIRRYVCHGVLWEEDGWAREEEEQTMRRKEDEEEDTKSRLRRGGTVMGEPHAWRGRRARTRSSRIANVRQKETREIKMIPMRGEDDPCKKRKHSDRGGHAGATMMPAFEIFSLSRILP